MIGRAGGSPTRAWRGKYYTRSVATELVEFLDTEFRAESPDQNWDFIWALAGLDSPDVRRLLRKWAERKGTSADGRLREEDQLRLSHLCVDELTVRGDDFAIQYVLDDRVGETDDLYVHIAADRLSNLSAAAVAAQIRQRLSVAAHASQRVRLLSLLGRFGDESDKYLIGGFVDNEDDLVANVAFESLLRLTDPLLVPDGWREI